MKIFLNGKVVDIAEGVSVADLVTLKKLSPKSVIVEYNNRLIDKKDWSEIKLKDQDKLEIFQLVGGG